MKSKASEALFLGGVILAVIASVALGVVLWLLAVTVA